MLPLLLLCLTATTVTASTCRAVTANYITHRLPQQCLRSGSGSSGGNYTATSIAVVTTRAGGEAEGGTQTAIEASGPTQIPSAGSTISSENAPIDTAAPPPPPPPPPLPEATENESEDSPLDTAKFLSFEEWKAQNLARAGQSSESFEDRVREPRRGGASGSLNSALDSLGEDAEIELDFGGETDGGVPEYKVGRSDKSHPATANGDGGGEDGDSPDPRGYARSRNAGTTCKERFNYASFDCAATVHKTNPEAKGATSILVENKDSYMLNKCGAEKKFFIVELCDDILVDTVVLANFEFFSSMFRSFKVFVSDRYPIKQNGWKDLGTFEARNSRQVQAFLIENPLIWARYLKVEFLTQYGNEFYCPVSLLRVHGTTMMEEFKNNPGEVSAGGAEEDIIEEVVPEAVAVNIEEEVQARVTAAALVVEEEEAPKGVHEVKEAPVQKVRIQKGHDGSAICRPLSVLEFGPLFLPTCAVMCIPSATYSTPTSVMTESSIIISAGIVPSSAVAMGAIGPTSAIPNPPENSASKEPAPATPSHAKEKERETASNTSTTSVKAPDTTFREPSHHQTPSVPPPPPPPPPPASSGSQVTHSHSHSHPPSAVPTTQESFFKTVHKRLSLLEANATLSLQYIEEQSRILRDAFVKVEKRQMEKTAQFIEKLNSTVLAELRNYKEQYDQLWQSTVIALESQNTQTDQQIQTLTTRLTLLTDELLFQRRIYQLQSLLLLLIIITAAVSVVILFNRGSTSSNSISLGGGRGLLARHLRSTSQDDDPQTPPPPTPRLPPSGGSLTSPTLKFSPPSPTTLTREEEEEEEQEDEEIEGTRSSPATPRGTRDVSARGSAWARFGPRLKADKGSGGTDGAGAVIGRWGRLPSPLGSYPAGSGYTSGYASGSGSSSEREC